MIAGALRRDYGPWPELWIEADELGQYAAADGLALIADQDWTAQTLPSYRTTAPDDSPERRRSPDAGNVMRWLHTRGWLSYRMLAFRRL